MSVFTLYAAQIASVLYDGIFNQTVDPGISRSLLGSDGLADPTFAGVLQANPRVGFSSYRIDQFLDLGTKTFATVGLHLTGASTLGLWFQKMKHGGVRDTTGHKKILVSEGLLYPKTLSAQQGQQAQIDVEAVACRTSSAEPFIVSTAALAGTPALSQPFTIGPVWLAGTALDYVQSVSIDFGLQLTILANQGYAAPEFVGIMQRQPTIRVDFTDASQIDDLGIYGSAITDISVGFRACTHGGVPLADDETEHVMVEATAGHVAFDQWATSNGNHMAPSLTFALTKGAGSILAVTTGVALTAGS